MKRTDISAMIEEITRAVTARGGTQKGDEYKFRCPAPDHEDDDPSAYWNPTKRAWICFGCGKKGPFLTLAHLLGVHLPRTERRGKGVSLEELATHKRLPVAFLESLGLRNRPDGKGVEIPYHDEEGREVTVKRRTHLVAKKGSYWPKGVPLRVYGAHRLGDAKRLGFLVLVEGESDCWTLWKHGVPALGIPGASTATSLELRHIEGVDRVYVNQESDQGGKVFGASVAKRIRTLGWRGWAGIVRMPESHKDPSDLYRSAPEDFQTRFEELLRTAEPIDPAAEASSEPSLPEIDAGDKNLARVAEQAWDALSSWNRPARLFVFEGRIVQIAPQSLDRAIPRPLTDYGLRYFLARCIRWYRTHQTDEGDRIQVDASPPMDVVRDMLASPEPVLPVLRRIAAGPTYGADGGLIAARGFHEPSGVYCDLPAEFSMPSVPTEPSAADVARARELILGELLVDFPFAGPADRANALGLLLLPFVRDLIDGPTPLHLCDKPCPGTGGTLLVRSLLFPSVAETLSTFSEGRDEDEWRKRITACLLNAREVVLIDNVRRPLDSAALAAAITSPMWEDRELGLSRTVAIRVRVVWVADGNNLVLSQEMSRRSVHIRLDAREERPWLRAAERFRHPQLMTWIREHRGDLCWAAGVLVRNWLARGRSPWTQTRLGMFERWSEVIGGILHGAGIEGFLNNAADLYEIADPESSRLAAFVDAWWEAFADRPVSIADLIGIKAIEVLDLGDGNPQSQKTRLGKKLAANRDRCFGTHSIRSAGKRRRAEQWQLVSVACEGVRVGEDSPPFAPRAENGDEATSRSPRSDAEGVRNPHTTSHPHTGPSPSPAVETPDLGDRSKDAEVEPDVEIPL